MTERPPSFTAALDRSGPAAPDINFIASAGHMAPEIARIVGDTALCTMPVEGYPAGEGSFYSNREKADALQQGAIDAVCKAFGCDYANVQPASASSANTAVVLGLYRHIAKPQARKLKMLADNTAHGGHFTQGHGDHITSEFASVSPIPKRQDSTLDMDALARKMETEHPDAVLVGGSSNTRQYDFSALRKLCDQHHCLLWVDASHHAGYMLAGEYPMPFPSADIVTSSMRKSFPGAQAGVILAKDSEKWGRVFDDAVHPGLQGEPDMAQIAATGAVVDYPRKNSGLYRQAYANARAMANAFHEAGLPVVGGGTDTHIVMLDLREMSISGRQAADFLARIGIFANQMPLPGDQSNDIRDVGRMSGLRFGTFAMTQCGFKEKHTEELSIIIADALRDYASLCRAHSTGHEPEFQELVEKSSGQVSAFKRRTGLPEEPFGRTAAPQM